jgi:hypothetical protein
MNEDSTKKLGDQQNIRLEQLFQLVQSMRSELADLKQTVDARLHDTRPIWEQVQADIAQLQEGQQNLTAGQQRFEEQQQRFEERQQRFEERHQRFEERQQSLSEKMEALRDEMRTGFRNLKRQFSVLHDTFLEVRADYKDLDKRVYRLEEERA